MTISAQIPESRSLGDGVVTGFSFLFKINSNTDLRVYVGDQLQSEGADYTITFSNDLGGGINMNTAPAVGAVVTMTRESPQTQTTDYDAFDDFPAASHEGALDKLTELVQELSVKSRLLTNPSNTKFLALDKPISDVADPVDDQDAATKSWTETTYKTLPPGAEGPAGPSIPGAAGLPGPQGVPLPPLSGVVTPPSSIGVEGQLYFNVNNGDMYVREVTGWALLMNIIGPPGSGGGGVSDHGALTGLTDPDHPISAVQGLQAALDAISVEIDNRFGSAPAVFRQATAPTGTIPTGSLWFDTANGERVSYYDGAAWIDVQDAQIDLLSSNVSDAISQATTAQATADGKVTTFFDVTAPIAEGVGDLWVESGTNQQYRWDGANWVQIQDTGISTALANAAGAQATADGKIDSYYQPTQPPIATAGIGDLWYDTDDGNHPYRFSGTGWVSIQDADIALVAQNLADEATRISGIEGQLDGVVNILYQSAPPTIITNPELSVGDLWVDEDDNQTYRWDGAQWVSIQDTSIAQAVSDSSNAIAVADQKIRAFYQNAEPDPGAVQIDTGDLWFDLDDQNRQYRWNGSAWIDIAQLVDLVNGELGEGGIRLDAISIQTSNTSVFFNAAGASQSHISPLHATSGARINVQASLGFSMNNIASFLTTPYAIAIERRADGGAWSSIISASAVPAGSDSDRDDVTVGTSRQSFIIWKINSSGLGKQNFDILFNFYDQVASGNIEYRMTLSGYPYSPDVSYSDGGTFYISTTEIKR